jgi:hypothetical protein
LRKGTDNLFEAVAKLKSNVPVQQQNFFPSNMILDPQLMGLDMGINLDTANPNFMLPIGTEQINSFEVPHAIENSQYLSLPMDSSQESSVTPDIMSSTQSNSTPATVPDVEDVEEEGMDEEESLLVTDQDDTIVHYGMVGIILVHVLFVVMLMAPASQR